MVEKNKIDYIVVACCTYKRPEKLDRMLKSLLELNYPKDIKTEILIVDNDKDKSSEEIVKKYEKVLSIHYFVEENKGLSNVRNKALKVSKELGASHLAFIDDDEIADINWLINHVDFYNRFENIYISSGPTYKKFEKDYPDYIVNNKIFKVYVRKKLGTLKKTCASGNVFFPLNHDISFSEDFNLSGGEDTNFFERMSEVGYKIGWNLNAVNYEIVDDERANVKWILKRAYNVGKINSIIKFKKNKNLFRKIFYIIEKFFISLFEIFCSIFFINATYFLNKLTKAAINMGKFSGALTLKLGRFYEE